MGFNHRSFIRTPIVPPIAPIVPEIITSETVNNINTAAVPTPNKVPPNIMDIIPNIKIDTTPISIPCIIPFS